MNKSTLLALSLLLSSLGGATALAQDAAQPAQASPPDVLVYLRVGGLFPQVLNKLETSYVFAIGGGWVIPALDHRLAVVADLAYTAPTRSQGLSDPRLASGGYQYDMDQRDLTLFVGAHYHFLDLRRSLWIPYAGLGLRLHFLETLVDGRSGGAPLGRNTETSTKVGGALRAGLGVRLGPGFVALELELAVAPIDHTITGDANIGALAASLGYTLAL